MIVDTHVHLWDLRRFHYPWLSDPGAEGLQWDYLADDLRADAKGVDVVATVHVQAEVDHAADPEEETAWLAACAREHPDDPLPTVCVGYADLRAPDLDDVLARHQAHALFRGIRQEAWFDPGSQRADILRFNVLDDPAWAAGLRRLAARELSFDLLVWTHQLDQAAAIFRELPELTLVLEHTGTPVDADPDERQRWRAAMRRFATDVPHAMLKISALIFVSPTWELAEIEPVVREALEIFGPDRCMFGSNFPVDRPAISYAQLWAAYGAFTADLSAPERAAVFCDNAVRTYRIALEAGAAR